MTAKTYHSKEVQKHIGLVVNQVKKIHQRNRDSDFDELVQVGMIALWRILKNNNYKDNLGAFSTYASKVIYRAVIKHIKKDASKNIPCTQIADRPIDGQLFFLWEYIPLDMTLQDIAILTMRYEGYTLQEIGDKLGFSREGVGKKLNKIYKRLRDANG